MMYNLKANPFPRNDLDLVSCELGLENDDYDDNNDNNKEIKIVELFWWFDISGIYEKCF